ncbi:MAG: Gfo/Idh/MocA family oxidoreductase [Clostridia bacterium]|nr:Gfo/Idh/MocA family oxidoreductase [Clostridia bacterium]
MSKKVLKCALVGCGYIGYQHLNAFLDCKNTELVALCNKEPQRLESLQKKFGIEKGFTDYKEMIKAIPDLDMVSICLPNKLHSPVTVDFLEAGINVLCEKPMAVSYEDAKKMIEAEERSSAKLMIVQNQRFYPVSQIMKRLNDEGRFGEIYHIRTGWRRPLGMLPSPKDTWEDGSSCDRSWYNSKDAYGGVLRDLGVHLLDLAMYITDFPKVKSVHASGYRKFTAGEEESFDYTSEDMVSAHIKFENGMSISMEVSFASMISEEKLFTNIYGTKAGAERTKDSVNLILPDDEYAYHVVPLNTKREREFMHCIHEFADALVNGKEIPVRAKDCIKIIEILDMLYASIEEN